jgi:putative CocE/NonD family hydrolase
MSLNSSPNETSDIIREFGVKQKMRDGVLLSSDIYRPAISDEKFPAIITRTPYMTVEGFQKNFAREAEFFARNGYAYVVQDCRGKNDSEGEFHPFFDDPQDGFDTLNWCSKQEWSNGSFGTTGASYQAWNQWGTAALHPPGLQAMICTVSLPDPVINVPFQNGALVLWMSEWMATVEGKRNTDTSIFASLKNYWHLPLETLDQTFGRKSKFWKNWIDHPSADDYWKKSFYQNKFGEIDVPVLHISGWYDDDLIGTHINYVGMKEKSPTEKSRKNQKLIIGPWPHHVNSSRTLGGMDFGEAALINLQKTKLDWFDHWLKGMDNGIIAEPSVEIFVMGKNTWKKTDTWPLKDTMYTKLYLHSDGRANTMYGDGKLTSSKPGGDGDFFDAYSYDPRNPCPNIFDTSITPAEGPFDQRSIERRDDVLVYSTDPMEKDLEVSGPVMVKLYAASSSKDTDFWAQLVDVFPNGYSMHLTEGIIRGRYRKSLETPELLEPQKIYEFNIDLWIISNVFMKDHVIRLHVSSSSFPKYDRNPNTGHEFGRNSELLTAQQTIYHNAEYPSHVLLPFFDESL